MSNINLYCFHHAGGSSVLFRQWKELLPAQWQLHLIDLPGRGLKSGLTPIATWATLLPQLDNEIELSKHNTAIFFGHSLGAMVAYHLAHYKRQKGKTEPDALYLSACRAPDQKASTNYGQMTHETLYTKLLSLGLLPNRKYTPEVQTLLTSVFKSDFMLAEHPPALTHPLPMPVHILHASEDTIVSTSNIVTWQKHCALTCTMHSFEGDHMYIEQNSSLITDILQRFQSKKLTINNNNLQVQWPMPLC